MRIADLNWTTPGARPACLAGLVAMLVALGAACQKPAPPPRPLVPVTVAKAGEMSVPLELRAMGAVEAYQTVDVKSQVNGIVTRIGFRQGQDVKQGQMLFRLDPRPFQAALDQAEGARGRDQAQLAYAELKEKRTATLFARQLSSQEALDLDKTAADALRAAVRADQATVQNARLQLEYATIVAPFAGRAGDLFLYPGNVVKANDAGAMVTIRQVRPIRVRFTVPERQLDTVRAHYARGPLTVKAFPLGEGAPPAVGTLTFLDNGVDATTGTVLLKGEFENADGALWPGQFADVALVLEEGTRSLVVPAEALQTGQQGPYVYVLQADQSVALRAVTPGRTVDGKLVVEKGLAAGETVVTDGQVRLTPGAKAGVKPPAEPAKADAGGAPAAR